MKKVKLLLSAATLGIIVISCSIDKSKNNKIDSKCHLSEKVIKRIRDQKGKFSKDESTGRLCIIVPTPGTIDEVSIYLICNVPFKLPLINTEVIVTGNVRESLQKSQLGGYNYYELELSKLN